MPGGDVLRKINPFSWECDEKCDSLLKFLHHQDAIDFKALPRKLIQVCTAMMKDDIVISKQNVKRFIEAKGNHNYFSYYTRVLLVNLIIRVISECDQERKVQFQEPATSAELALPSAMSLLHILVSNVFDHKPVIVEKLEFISFILVERMVGKHKDGDHTACYDILTKYTCDIPATYLTRLKDMVDDNFSRRPPLSDKDFLHAILPKVASINSQLDKPFLLRMKEVESSCDYDRD